MSHSPLIASLLRHKLTAGLLVMQVALTCAIVCNVASIIGHRLTQMQLPSGVAENELVLIESISVDESANPLARHDADLAALRAIPGVTSVTAVDSLPLSGNNWSNGISLVPNGPSLTTATAYSGTQEEMRTLGMHLVSGRLFLPEEYIPLGAAHDWSGINHVSSTIITQALAAKLFPGQDPLGKVIYPGDGPIRIVGVVDHLLRPTLDESEASGYATLFPMLPDGAGITYVMRSAPQERERVLRQAQKVLAVLDGNRVLRRPQTFEQLRSDYFRRDRTMISLLLAAATGLLLVTAAGITGLASFWVQQRRRSIGIRRAVGATRADILRYFQTENFVIVGAGVVLGAVLAYGLNMLLMEHYALRRLPWFYLPAGAVALWGLGQLAVLGPALRASMVPPVVATRG
ncbi:ABC transporter permease [Dyella japonica]|uniref:ABC transporter permease n=1 Tax=Dyella japonica A8 TaxID=1217721 RepID=A0A075JWR3_9GAMM|nr:FtsX-like permease family protein [Dyella japonica]AIF45917.1 ABC transporter permease [Dyella japonica A8]